MYKNTFFHIFKLERSLKKSILMYIYYFQEVYTIEYNNALCGCAYVHIQLSRVL